VLVIDDNRDARVLMRNHLREAGFDVETASSGPEGIEQARELQPMAITLDVLMDEMDGWEVLTQLKDDPDLRHLPVVMITITPDEGRGFQLGATDHLTKPVDRDHLAGLLEKYRADAPALTVLLIDYDAEARDMTRAAIEEEEQDHEIYEAENGRAALDLIEEEDLAPDLVLLDLMMPEMNGFEFIEAVRERELLPDVPVVVLTAKNLTEEDVQRLDGSIEQIIQKGGYTRDGLLEVVQQRVAVFRDEQAATTEADTDADG
jgi:CheY-like chemotaxis protein